MDKNQKIALGKELASLYGSNEHVFYVDFTGLTVERAKKLRRMLAGSATCIVVKNTINKVAANQTNFSHACDVMTGQVMTIFSNDPVTPAKCLSEAAKDFNFKIIGYANSKSIENAEYVEKLSKLPSLDEIRSSLLGTISSVQSSIARMVNEVPSSLARVISKKS